MKPKVLFIDDDELVLDMYRRSLGRQFEVRTAESGKTALAAVVSDGPFAVIVSDLRMPGVSGLELLRSIKTISPHSSRLLMTGVIDIPDLQKDPGLAVISKPCPTPELVQILAQAAAEYYLRLEPGVIL